MQERHGGDTAQVTEQHALTDRARPAVGPSLAPQEETPNSQGLAVGESPRDLTDRASIVKAADRARTGDISPTQKKNGEGKEVFAAGNKNETGDNHDTEPQRRGEPVREITPAADYLRRVLGDRQRIGRILSSDDVGNSERRTAAERIRGLQPINHHDPRESGLVDGRAELAARILHGVATDDNRYKRQAALELLSLTRVEASQGPVLQQGLEHAIDRLGRGQDPKGDKTRALVDANRKVIDSLPKTADSSSRLARAWIGLADKQEDPQRGEEIIAGMGSLFHAQDDQQRSRTSTDFQAWQDGAILELRKARPDWSNDQIARTFGLASSTVKKIISFAEDNEGSIRKIKQRRNVAVPPEIQGKADAYHAKKAELEAAGVDPKKIREHPEVRGLEVDAAKAMRGLGMTYKSVGEQLGGLTSDVVRNLISRHGTNLENGAVHEQDKVS